MEQLPGAVPFDLVRFVLHHPSLATIALHRAAGTPQIGDLIDAAHHGRWSVTWIIAEASLEFGAIVGATRHTGMST